jgi:hypothetical protein
MTPGSLESASLTTWSTQLNSIEAYAGQRDRFGAELVSYIAEPLRQVAIKYDEIRKNHVEYHGKLEKERESAMGDLKKAKGKYDGVCQEVENRRKKVESSFDFSKTKAQTSYQQQLLEMNNVKVRLSRLVLCDDRTLTAVVEHLFDWHQYSEQVKRAILSRICSRSLRCKQHPPPDCCCSSYFKLMAFSELTRSERNKSRKIECPLVIGGPARSDNPN